MTRKSQKAAAIDSKTSGPMSETEIGDFINEVHEARHYVEDLERKQIGLTITEIVARKEHLPKARAASASLDKKLKELRGDCVDSSQADTAIATSPAAKPDGRMKIQAEAYEHWIRLKASGANPTINSICDSMANWCADNGVTTHTGTTPRPGTIRNSILGGSSGWEPPTHTRDQAKAHVEQLAQVAQQSSATAS